MRSVVFSLLLVSLQVGTAAAAIKQDYFVSANNKLYIVLSSIPSGGSGTVVTSIMITDGTASFVAEVPSPFDPVATAFAFRLTGDLLHPIIRHTQVISGLPSNTIINDSDDANGEFYPGADGGNGLLVLPGGTSSVAFNNDIANHDAEPLNVGSGPTAFQVPAAVQATVTRRMFSTYISAPTIVFPWPAGPPVLSAGATCVGGSNPGTYCAPLPAPNICTDGGVCIAYGGESPGQNVTLDDTVGTRVGNPFSQVQPDGFLLRDDTDLVVFVADAGAHSAFGAASAGFVVSGIEVPSQLVLDTSADADNDALNPPLTENASDAVSAGASLTTDPEDDGATADDAMETTVTPPADSNVSIVEGPYLGGVLDGFFVINQQAAITVTPPATPEIPIVLEFEIDASVLPASFGTAELAIGLPVIFRNGAFVDRCTVPPPPGFPSSGAAPDPCVSSRVLEDDGDLVITVRTSSASDWSLAFPSGECPATADGSCMTGFTKGLLLIKQEVPGKEKLVAKFLNGPSLTQLDFGNPLDSAQGGTGTFHSLCVYDQAGNLAGKIEVDRPGATCAAAPCWKPIGRAPTDSTATGKGYAYRDASGLADGVQKLLLKGGTFGKSKVILKARGPNMPKLIPERLQSSTAVTMQLRATNGVCLSAQLNDIQKAEISAFKAQ